MKKFYFLIKIKKKKNYPKGPFVAFSLLERVLKKVFYSSNFN